MRCSKENLSCLSKCCKGAQRLKLNVTHYEFSFPRTRSNAARKESREIRDFQGLRDMWLLKVTEDFPGFAAKSAKWDWTVPPGSRATRG